MAKVVKVNTKEKVKFTVKKDDKDGFACLNCGYSGRGTYDEESRRYICPECGADLEEGDLLKMRTPDSYDKDEGTSVIDPSDIDLNI